MSAGFRYTGANSVIIFNGTTISNDWSTLDLTITQRMEDRTAGGDTDQSYNATIIEGKAAFKRFDTGTNDGGIAAALKPGTTGTLEIRWQGTAGGLPVYSAPFIVDSYKVSTAFNKNVVTDVSFSKNGPATKNFGATQ